MKRQFFLFHTVEQEDENTEPPTAQTNSTTKMTTTTTELLTTLITGLTTTEKQIMSAVDALTSGEIVGITFAIAAVVSFVIILILGVCIFCCIRKKHSHTKAKVLLNARGSSKHTLSRIFQITQPESYFPLDGTSASRLTHPVHFEAAKTISKPDCWELLPSDIIMGELLGEGAFGEVYKGFLTGKLENIKVNHLYRNKANIVVAVKILKGIIYSNFLNFMYYNVCRQCSR